MAARKAGEPYKPVTIDKKLGEIYLTDKCTLFGPFTAPKQNPFTEAHAKQVATKFEKEKKPLKAKIVALADSLTFKKAGAFGKKPVYAKVKYSDIKTHDVFNEHKKAVILGIQISGKPQEYLAVGFVKPMLATQLNDKLSYADQAPKNSLKSKLAAPVEDEPAPAIAIENHGEEKSSSSSSSPSTPKPKEGGDKMESRRSSRSRSSSSSAVVINEEAPVAAPISAAPASRGLTTPQSVASSRISGLPRQPAHSPTTSTSRSASPVKVTQAPPTPPPLPATVIAPPTKQRDSSSSSSTSIAAPRRSRSSTPKAQKQPSLSSSEERKPSPKKTPVRKMSSSSSSSRVEKKQTKQSAPVRKSRSSSSTSHEVKPKRDERHSETPNSMGSRHTLTTDASACFVTREEAAYLQEGRLPMVRESIVAAPGRSRSSSSSSSSTQKHGTSKKDRRSMASSKDGYVKRNKHQHCNHGSSDISVGHKKPLFILASGQFKPLSELARSDQDQQDTGVCSICGETGVGGPRLVEIIRTDSKSGPTLSKDGTVYMYSTTHPVDNQDRYGHDKPKKSKPRSGRRSRSLSQSSSSSRSSSYSDYQVQKSSQPYLHAKPPGSEYYKRHRSRTGSQSIDGRTPVYKHRSRTNSSDSRGPVYKHRSRTSSRDSDFRQPVVYKHRSRGNSHESFENVPISYTKPQQYRSRTSSSSSSQGRPRIYAGVVDVNVVDLKRDSTPIRVPTPPTYQPNSGSNKKIYRLDSSESDSSTSTAPFGEKANGGSGGIKVTPLSYE